MSTSSGSWWAGVLTARPSDPKAIGGTAAGADGFRAGAGAGTEAWASFSVGQSRSEPLRARDAPAEPGGDVDEEEDAEEDKEEEREDPAVDAGSDSGTAGGADGRDGGTKDERGLREKTVAGGPGTPAVPTAGAPLDRGAEVDKSSVRRSGERLRAGIDAPEEGRANPRDRDCDAWGAARSPRPGAAAAISSTSSASSLDSVSSATELGPSASTRPAKSASLREPPKHTEIQ